MASTKLKKIVEKDVLIIVLVIIASLILVAINARKSGSPSVSNFCKPAGSAGGTDTIKASVPKTGTYAVWVNIETPKQIDFNDLPNVYNPLLVSVDNSSCYEMGGNKNVTLNTWIWVNYLNSSASFKIKLKQGNHTFSVSGVDASIDRIELVNGSCVPVANGSNCLPKTKSDISL
jgi:hypothetical protein